MIVPEIASILATPGVSLLQTPPDVVFENNVVAPIQTDDPPVIAGTTGSAVTETVVVLVVVHPLMVTA